MVKGCQRRMVCLKQTGSEWFEEAYFLLREEKQAVPCDEESLLREANRIVSEQGVAGKRAQGGGMLNRLFYASIGATVAFLLCALLAWVR